MKSRWGKLLTKNRLRLLDNYKRSRTGIISSPRLSRREHFAARAWVDSFERFMCCGWDPELTVYGIESSQSDAQRHDPGVSPQDTQLDRRSDAGDASP